MHHPPMARGVSAVVAPAAAMAVVAVVVAAAVVAVAEAGGGAAKFQPSYGAALEKCILFFEGQRSGKLPPSQRMRWRSHSALLDGHDAGVDLTGGYYDAGDNVKFGFPMAFTTTVLAWSVLEFGGHMGGEADNARDAVRWATDYLLKATSEANKVHVQVGDPYSDHGCWERPEDMDTKRTVFTVDVHHRGSEVAAETAAALAAGSLVFSSSDPTYADQLLQRSKEVFSFADKYRGSYADSLRHWVCPFYCDFSGYMDELGWGAAWLYQATNDKYYWNYTLDNFSNLIGTGGFGEFGWDDKHAGISVLISKKLLAAGEATNPAIQKADEFVCSVLPESPTKAVRYSPGGLLFKNDGSNMQNAAATSFLLIVYSRYLTTVSGGRPVRCGSTSVPPSRLVELARSQADYILGKNPMGMSYMVGYGDRFPQRIHHRGSSLPSVAQHPEIISCADGTPFYLSKGPNRNLLVGAIVGGPNISDSYPDSRSLFVQSEPTTYINAPMVGVFAFFNAAAAATT